MFGKLRTKEVFLSLIVLILSTFFLVLNCYSYTAPQKGLYRTEDGRLVWVPAKSHFTANLKDAWKDALRFNRVHYCFYDEVSELMVNSETFECLFDSDYYKSIIYEGIGDDVETADCNIGVDYDSTERVTVNFKIGYLKEDEITGVTVFFPFQIGYDSIKMTPETGGVVPIMPHLHASGKHIFYFGADPKFLSSKIEDFRKFIG